MKRRVLALCGAVAIAVVPPLLLYGLTGPPYLPRFNWNEIASTLKGSYLPVETIVRALGLVGWALWMYVALIIVLESLGRILARRRSPFAEPLLRVTAAISPRIVRRMADALVGSAVLASSMTIVSTAPPMQARPNYSSLEMRPTSMLSSRPVDAAATAQPHLVSSGECLWKIAGAQLGDPRRWPEIFELNRGKQFDDGRLFTNPNLIRPGWRLDLPIEGAEQIQAPLASSDSAGIVQTDIYRGGPAQTSENISSHPEVLNEVDEDRHLIPPLIVVPSGGALALSFASGVLAAEALAALRRRRSRRISDPDFGQQDLPTYRSNFADELKRSLVSPNASGLQAGAFDVANAWRKETGRWPRILFGFEAAAAARFVIGAEEGVSIPSNATRVEFSRLDSNLVLAEMDAPTLPRTKHLTPLQNPLLVPLGATPTAEGVHLGTLGLGVISISGTDSLRYSRQLALSLIAASTPDHLEMRVLGKIDFAEELLSIAHTRKASGWDVAEVEQLEVEALTRSRSLMEMGGEDQWSDLAEQKDEWIPALAVIATEPPSDLKERVEVVVERLASLGGILVALGWIPRCTQLRVRVHEQITSDPAVPLLGGSLIPLLLTDESLTEVSEIVSRAHPSDAKDAGPAHSDTADEVIPPESPPTITAVPSKSDVTQVEGDQSPLPQRPPLQIDVPDLVPSADQDGGSGIWVKCLGPLTVTRGGELLMRWRAGAKELLAYLIAHQAATKDQVIEDLLSNKDDLRLADLELNRMVSQIRQTIRPPTDKAEYILRSGGTIRLETQRVRSDVALFDDLLATAELFEPLEEIELLRKAVDLYRGEFCSDLYVGVWIDVLRTKYRERFVRASARLAELLSEHGEPEGALAVIDRAIEFDAMNEEIHRKAIHLEGVALGRTSWARKRFDNLKRILREELDVDPEPETIDLMKNLRTSVP